VTPDTNQALPVRETMVTEVKIRFSGMGHGMAETRGWNEELFETRQRLINRCRENYGSKVRVEILHQVEVYYAKGTGRELRRVVY
jgi:hypothetical protein